MQFTQLENENVLLKPMDREDVAGIFAAAYYPEVWSHLPISVESEEDVE